IETGDRSAAVVYKNIAVDHGLPFRSLPPRLNFAHPRLAEWYATATYTTEDGRVFEGTPVLYNATVPTAAPDPEAGRAFLEFLLARPALLRANGLVVGDAHPIANGPVPEAILP
ncbi:MAG: substrate-binding domain-containing protein, partial [Halanaeroarchaeum sp.]